MESRSTGASGRCVSGEGPFVVEGGGERGTSIFGFDAENFESDFNNLITWNVFYIYFI